MTLLGKALGAESILPAAITARCRSLILLGAGTVVGSGGRERETNLRQAPGGVAPPAEDA